MKIEGRCHCGDISYMLDWPGGDPGIPLRACSCSFCAMHGAAYASHRGARLDAVVNTWSDVSRYRFGTKTAEFHVCSRCGGIPFVTCLIEGRLYAVVNVNTFVGIDRSTFCTTVTNFSDETTEKRLDRRARTWIPNVIIREQEC